MPDENLLNDLLAEIKQLRQTQEEVLKTLGLVGKSVWVQDGDKKKLLRIPEISFITTNPKGLDIYTTTGEKYINFDSIGETAKELKDDPLMMKTHKSFIINLNQIDTVNVIPGGRELTFKNLSPQITVKVSSDYVEEFEKRLGK